MQVSTSFSPDGSAVVCILRSWQTDELYRAPLILDAPDMRPRPLPELPGMVEALYGVSWHPGSKQIVFTLVERDSRNFGIWLFDVERNQARPLVHPENDQLLQCPLFSHDGRSVLFRNAITYGLLRCDAATGKVKTLPDIGQTTRVGYAWGATDNAIWASVYTALVRVPLDGTPAERIDGTASVSVVAPSPDGRLLASLREQPDPNEQHYRLGLFDTTAKTLKDLGVAMKGYALSWRPDGAALAYVGGQPRLGLRCGHG